MEQKYDPQDFWGIRDFRKEFTDTIETYRVFSSIEKALESQSFDGIVISSPPVFHEEQAILALKAGTSVLLEKPIGLTMSKMGALRCALEEAYRANNVNLLLVKIRTLSIN